MYLTQRPFNQARVLVNVVNPCKTNNNNYGTYAYAIAIRFKRVVLDHKSSGRSPAERA